MADIRAEVWFALRGERETAPTRGYRDNFCDRGAEARRQGLETPFPGGRAPEPARAWRVGVFRA